MSTRLQNRRHDSDASFVWRRSGDGAGTTVHRDEGKCYPLCLAGKRACPPEDCGGIWGYAGFLAAVRDPQHPEHEAMLEWVGGEFDPDIFDLDEVNRELQRLPSPGGRRQR